MNVTTCIFASPIFKYIYYLILYQWQLYIHVRSTILFSFFFWSSSIFKCIHYQSEFYTHLVRYDQQYQGPGDYDFCTSEVFHSPLDVRDCLNSRSAQNDSDIVAWWSGNAISRKGRPRCLGTAAQISSIQNSRIISVKHSTSLHVPHSNEWHTTFFYQIFLIAFIN